MIKEKFFLFLLVIPFLMFSFGCQNRIESTKILETEIPSPTSGTLIYLSTIGFPGWQIMSRQENQLTFRVSTGPFDVDPDWSWDKQRIVYERGVPPHQFLQIWKMKYNGDEKIPLTPDGIDCQTPSFSPDGRQIAFAALTDTTRAERHLVITDASGRGWRQITTDSTTPGFAGVSFTTPSWFPDGKQVVAQFAGSKNGAVIQMLGIVDLTTGVFTPLSAVSHLSPWLPNVSPDGKKIAFVSGANGGGTDIFTVNVDGTDLQQFTNNRSSWEPDWSPDGKQIAFSQVGDDIKSNGIWIMNADGSGKKLLIPVPENGAVGKPRW